MQAQTSLLAVVVPTRNRADFASRAVDSVIRNADKRVVVVVSDNSTDAKEVHELQAFCLSVGSGVIYLRPPRSMPMAEHWEWALQQVFVQTKCTHVAFLTDRMMFKESGVGELLRLMAKFPNGLISYNHDRIDDLQVPVHLEQVSWTGDIFRLESEQMLASCSQLSWQFFSCLPRMLNCIVPRHVFDVIAGRYGSVFLSTAPDCCFAFRYLACFSDYFFFDAAPAFHYGLARSNGASQATGSPSTDHRDFMAQLGERDLAFATPVPQFPSVWNTIVHEYLLAAKNSESTRFNKINEQAYLDLLQFELRSMVHSASVGYFQLSLDDFARPLGLVPRELAWKEPKSQVLPFDDITSAIRHARARSRQRSWSRSSVEINLPGPPSTLGIDGFFRQLTRHILHSLRNANRIGYSSRHWFERNILWRLRAR